MSDNPEVQAWIDEARNADILAVAEQRQYGLRRAGADWNGPCPLGCAKEDGFVITPRKGMFHCRPSGKSGDVIGMIQHAEQAGFLEAVEIITGRSNPATGRSDGPSPEERQRCERERQDRKQKAEADEARQVQRKIDSATSIWSARKAMLGTVADVYLRGRGIALPSYDGVDLGFIDGLPYWGFATPETKELTLLGHFPAMVGAIRLPDGALIGVHRTFIKPDGSGKIIPPGDTKRNKAKKIEGQAEGGLIRLSYLDEVLCVAEGIETTLAYSRLARNVENPWSYAAGISLGNMRGGCTGSVDHPSRINPKTGKKLAIPNGIPAMDKRGMLVPPMVRTLFLLGDGDSDHPSTVASILTAVRRASTDGIEVIMDFAGSGADFNDELLAEISPGAVAA